MNTTYLLLGSNIGNIRLQLAMARKHIETSIGSIIHLSELYATAAWGKNDQPDFINQVVAAETTLSAGETMNTIFDIEKIMGRIRTVKNAPRVIDIDILFFNNDVINTSSLTIPHPLMQERKFVLVPLNEVAPAFIHPVLHKTPAQLLAACTDRLKVNKI